ncbi:unnamed protein product [Closterium sp. NIES-54]
MQRPELLGRLRAVSSNTQRRSASSLGNGGGPSSTSNMAGAAANTSNAAIIAGNGGPPETPIFLPMTMCSQTGVQGVANHEIPSSFNSLRIGENGVIRSADSQTPSTPGCVPLPAVAPHGAAGSVTPPVPLANNSTGMGFTRSVDPAHAQTLSTPEIGASATVAPIGSVGVAALPVPSTLNAFGTGENARIDLANTQLHPTPGNFSTPTSAPAAALGTASPLLQAPFISTGMASHDSVGPVDGGFPSTPSNIRLPWAGTTHGAQAAASSYNTAPRSSFGSGASARTGPGSSQRRLRPGLDTHVENSVARGDEVTETCSPCGNGRVCTARWTPENTTDLLTIILHVQQSHGLQPHEPIGSWRDVHREWSQMHADRPYTLDQLENRLRVVKRWLHEIKWLQEQVLEIVSRHQMWRERAHRWQHDIAPWLDLAAQLDSNGGSRGQYATTGDDGPRSYSDDPGALGEGPASEGTSGSREGGDSENAGEGSDGQARSGAERRSVPNGVDSQTNEGGHNMGNERERGRASARGTEQRFAPSEGAGVGGRTGGTASPGLSAGGGAVRSPGLRHPSPWSASPTTFSRSSSFRHALVSKRWYRLATSVLSHLTIQHRGFRPNYFIIEIHSSEHFRNAQLAWLPLPRLLSALRRFPTLTHVSLGEFSILSADGDAIFQCLAATCPSLSHLTVEHQFRMAVTVDGLASLFHGCRKLRELRLLTTTGLPHLPSSISLLTDLQTLHVCAHPLYGDDSLQELVSPPESIGALQQLRELRVSAGASFQGLGECVGLLKNLRKLSISSVFSRTVTELPDAIADLARLETLEIELDGLECIPESFQLLTGLKTLSIQSENLQSLPENVMAGLTQLQSLSLHACDSLGILPESICFLPLSSLSISSCSSLTSLPHHIGALSHLQTVKLLYLDNIRALPESLGDLPRLKMLELVLPTLQHLPERLCESSLPACLEKLSLTNCYQLKELPPSLYKLTRLESLHIESCSEIKSLKPLTSPNPPEGAGSGLESLSPVGKAIIFALCTAAVFAVMLLISVPLLTVRDLIGLSSAAMLAFTSTRSGSPDVVVASLLLVVVVLLMSLVSSAWLYPAMLLAAALLVFLFIDIVTAASAPPSSPACVSIPVSDSATNSTEQRPGLVSLTRLKISNCPMISSLPENFSFPALHTLSLHSLGNLENLMDLSSRQLPQLQHLELERVGDDADPWLLDCLPGVRSGRMRWLLRVKAQFVLLQVMEALLQLAVLLMRAGCSGLLCAYAWLAGLA